MYANALDAAQQSNSPLAVRLRMHCHHRLGQSERAMACSAQLGEGVEDQMSLATLLLLQQKHQVLYAQTHSCWLHTCVVLYIISPFCFLFVSFFCMQHLSSEVRVSTLAGG